MENMVFDDRLLFFGSLFIEVSSVDTAFVREMESYQNPQLEKV